MKAVFITLIVMVGVCVLANMGLQGTQPEKVVYQMCQSSRMGRSVSEQTCADLQQQYGVEFLCKQANDRIDNECWVETK